MARVLSPSSLHCKVIIHLLSLPPYSALKPGCSAQLLLGSRGRGREACIAFDLFSHQYFWAITMCWPSVLPWEQDDVNTQLCPWSWSSRIRGNTPPKSKDKWISSGCEEGSKLGDGGETWSLGRKGKPTLCMVAGKDISERSCLSWLQTNKKHLPMHRVRENVFWEEEQQFICRWWNGEEDGVFQEQSRATCLDWRKLMDRGVIRNRRAGGGFRRTGLHSSF